MQEVTGSSPVSPTNHHFQRKDTDIRAVHDELAQELLPMFDDAIIPLDWLWEPEITAELDSQVQALVSGDTDPASVGRAVEAVAQELRDSGRSYYP